MICPGLAAATPLGHRNTAFLQSGSILENLAGKPVWIRAIAHSRVSTSKD